MRGVALSILALASLLWSGTLAAEASSEATMETLAAGKVELPVGASWRVATIGGPVAVGPAFAVPMRGVLSAANDGDAVRIDPLRAIWLDGGGSIEPGGANGSALVLGIVDAGSAPSATATVSPPIGFSGPAAVALRSYALPPGTTAALTAESGPRLVLVLAGSVHLVQPSVSDVLSPADPARLVAGDVELTNGDGVPARVLVASIQSERLAPSIDSPVAVGSIRVETRACPAGAADGALADPNGCPLAGDVPAGQVMDAQGNAYGLDAGRDEPTGEPRFDRTDLPLGAYVVSAPTLPPGYRSIVMLGATRTGEGPWATTIAPEHPNVVVTILLLR